jgi:hypothetical protein
LTGVFKWDERGVDILGKISGGAGLPFGLPLDKRRMKYFNYTVSDRDQCLSLPLCHRRRRHQS